MQRGVQGTPDYHCSLPTGLWINITSLIVKSVYVVKWTRYCGSLNKSVLCTKKTLFSARCSFECVESFSLREKIPVPLIGFITFALQYALTVMHKMRPWASLGFTPVFIWVWDGSKHLTWPPFPQWHTYRWLYSQMHTLICVWINYESWLSVTVCFIIFLNNYEIWVTYLSLFYIFSECCFGVSDTVAVIVFLAKTNKKIKSTLGIWLNLKNG